MFSEKSDEQERRRISFCVAISFIIHMAGLGLDPTLFKIRGQVNSSIGSSSVTRRPPLQLTLPSLSKEVIPLPGMEIIAEDLPDPSLDREVVQTQAILSESNAINPIKEDPVLRHSTEPMTTSQASAVLGPWYYPAHYLHRRPSPLKPILPTYPAAAEGLSGHVVIRLLISETGAVDNVRIESSDPPMVFESVVIDAFAAAEFAPGIISSIAVKSQVLIEVTFEPGAMNPALIKFLDTH
jgi:TonB family protein